MDSGDGSGPPELTGVFRAISQPPQDRIGVGTGSDRRRRVTRIGGRESRSRSGLEKPPNLDEGSSIPIVRMLRGFLHREHRGDTGIAPLKHSLPLLPAPTGELGGDRVTHLRPALAIHLWGKHVRVELESVEQLLEELGLQGTYRHVLPIGGSVGGVEGSCSVQEV